LPAQGLIGVTTPVLREMMDACRPAGVLPVPGVYGGLIDKVPFGTAMNKTLT
jgi:threonine dehydrogenase-like Zn-dependent dehydrogenase